MRRGRAAAKKVIAPVETQVLEEKAQEVNLRRPWNDLTYDERNKLIEDVRKGNMKEIEKYEKYKLALYGGYLVDEAIKLDNTEIIQFFENNGIYTPEEQPKKTIKLMAINFDRNPHLSFVHDGQIYENIEKDKIDIYNKLSPMINNKQPTPYKELKIPKLPNITGKKLDDSMWKDDLIRKNTLTIIEFVTKFYSEPLTVVIINHAEYSINIYVIANLFKNIRFYVKDKFHVKEEGDTDYGDRNYIKTNEDPDYDNLGAYIMIVNVDTTHDQQTDEQKRDHIVQDLEEQKNMVKDLRPFALLSRFVLPWNLTEPVNYLEGDFISMPNVNLRSVETRLLSVGTLTETQYTVEMYERMMSYHNQYTRGCYFVHNLQDVKGLDHCATCKRAIDIIRKYIEFMNEDMDKLQTYYETW